LKDLVLGQFQEINFQNITHLKFGQKAGRKLSDADSRWVEKWMEVRFVDKEISLADVSF
jgi:protein gp37